MLRNQGSSLLPRVMSVANSGRRCDLERFCRELWGYQMLRPQTLCVRMPLALAWNNWQLSDRHVSTEACPAVSGVRGEGTCTQETGQSGLIPELHTSTQKTHWWQVFFQCHS